MSTIGESICGTNAKIKLRELASSVNQIKGDVVEVGVYKDGTVKILADMFVDSSIFLFDTCLGSKKAIDEFVEENGYTLMVGGDFQRYIIY